MQKGVHQTLREKKNETTTATTSKVLNSLAKKSYSSLMPWQRTNKIHLLNYVTLTLFNTYILSRNCQRFARDQPNSIEWLRVHFLFLVCRFFSIFYHVTHTVTFLHLNAIFAYGLSLGILTDCSQMKLINFINWNWSNVKDDENFLLFAAHLMWKQLKEREKENDNKSEGKQNHKHRDRLAPYRWK